MPYVEVTISSGLTSGTLTDFPMLLIGDEFPDDYWAHTRTDGMDVLPKLVDGTVLSKDLIAFDQATKKQQLWVKIPSHLTSANTVIRLHYGDGVSRSNSTGTWRSDYYAAWPLEENPTASAPQFLDRTANARHGTANSMVSGDSVTAIVGKAIRFQPNKYISVASFNFPAAFSISMQVRLVSATGVTQRLVTKSGSANDDFDLWVQVRADRTVEFGFYGTDAGGYGAVSSSALTVGADYSLTVGSTGTAVKIYLDGADVTSSATNPNSVAPRSTANPLTFGRLWVAGNAYYGTDVWIDEPRILALAPSAEWALAESRALRTPASYYTVSAEVSDSHTLTLQDLAGVAALGAVALSQTHALVATPLIAQADVEGVALSLSPSLAVADLVATAVAEALALAQSHVTSLVNLTGAGALSSIEIGQTHALLVDEFLSTAVINSVALLQGEFAALTVADLAATAVLDVVALAHAHALEVPSLGATTVLDSTAIDQAHRLSVADLAAQAALQTVAITGRGLGIILCPALELITPTRSLRRLH